MGKLLSHQSFLKKVKNDKVTILTEYKGYNSCIYVQDNYGLLKTTPAQLILGNNIKITTALNKEQYFTNKFSEFINKNGIEIIKYNTTQNILIKDKYGLIKSTYLNFHRNAIPGIETAIDKDSYMKNIFRKVHGNKYIYKKAKYSGNSNLVLITCKYHGDFKSRFYNHANGSGCIKCNAKGCHIKGYLRSSCKKVKLYIVNLYNEQENFYKIGVTKQKLKYRLSKFPYNCNVIKVIESSPLNIISLENNLLKYHQKHSYAPQKAFAGSAKECFTKLMINYGK